MQIFCKGLCSFKTETTTKLCLFIYRLHSFSSYISKLIFLSVHLSSSFPILILFVYVCTLAHTFPLSTEEPKRCQIFTNWCGKYQLQLKSRSTLNSKNHSRHLKNIACKRIAESFLWGPTECIVSETNTDRDVKSREVSTFYCKLIAT